MINTGMQAKVGGILKGFTIHRKDGTVERYDKPLHNYMTAGSASTMLQYLANATSTTLSLAQVLQFRIYNQQMPVKLTATGTYFIGNSTGQAIGVGTGPWNQLRVLSGTSPSSNSILLLDDGEYAYITGTNGTHRILSKDSLDIVGKDLYWLRSELDVSSVQTGNQPTRSMTYSNGVLQSVNTQIATLTAVGANTIYSIGFSAPSSSSVAHIFDLDTPVVLGIGDTISVGVGDFLVYATYQTYQPRSFGVGECPLAGFPTATGTYQRLFPIISSTSPPGHEGSGTTNDGRIYLVPNGSQIAIPNFIYPSTTGTTAADLTSKETIICLGELQTAGPTNNVEAYRIWWGQVATGGAAIKQIAWGIGSPDRLYGIIEFDTPQNIPAGKILNVQQRYQLVPEFVIPNIP